MNLKAVLTHRFHLPNIDGALNYKIAVRKPQIKLKNAIVAVIVVGLCAAQGYAMVKTSKIDSGVETISSMFPTILNKINNLDLRVSKVETSSVDNAISIAVLNDSIKELQNDVANLKGTTTEVTTLQKKVTSLTYRISKLQKKKTTHKK